MLLDNHGRQINYLRLAVTDRCNLRCFYCMPEEGIDYVSRKDLLSYEEMLRLAEILGRNGVNKIRITGGEPFIRKSLMSFLERLKAVPGIDKLHITTNGTLTKGLGAELKRIGVDGVNLSLDSLDRWKFEKITRRDKLPEVIETMHELIDAGLKLKINMVVMEQHNTEDIIPMAELGKELPIDVRYIEEMPFNGGNRVPTLKWDHRHILEILKNKYPELQELPVAKSSTSRNFKVPGFKGDLGIIPAFSRTFCGTCNRIRVTPQGDLRTCLYGAPALQLRDLLRSEENDEKVLEAIQAAISKRALNGFEAEEQKRKGSSRSASESMSTIGG